SDSMRTSPLSPARLCASSYNLVICLHLHDRKVRLDVVSRNHPGHDAHHFIYILPGAAAPCWPVCIKGFHLFPNQLGLFKIVCFPGNTKTDFVWGFLMVKSATVCRSHPDVIHF